MVSHAITADINEEEYSEAVDLFEVPVVSVRYFLNILFVLAVIMYYQNL